jgi:hypothetical protein
MSFFFLLEKYNRTFFRTEKFIDDSIQAQGVQVENKK